MYKDSSIDDFMSGVQKWYNELSDESRNAIIGGVLGGIGVGGATYLTGDKEDDSKYRVREALRGTVIGTIGGASLGGVGTKVVSGLSDYARSDINSTGSNYSNTGNTELFTRGTAGDLGFLTGASLRIQSIVRDPRKLKYVSNLLKKLRFRDLKLSNALKLGVKGLVQASTVLGSGVAGELIGKGIHKLVHGNSGTYDNTANRFFGTRD